MDGGSRSVGRPSLGVTKKVSLTLPGEDWQWLESIMDDSGLSLSALVRSMIQSSLYGSLKNIDNGGE